MKNSSGSPHLFWYDFLTLWDQTYHDCPAGQFVVLNAITGVRCQYSVSAWIAVLLYGYVSDVFSLMSDGWCYITVARNSLSILPERGECGLWCKDVHIGFLLAPMDVLRFATSFLCCIITFCDLMYIFSGCATYNSCHGNFPVTVSYQLVPYTLGNPSTLLYSPVFYQIRFKASSCL